jgi:hypothetical protein
MLSCIGCFAAVEGKWKRRVSFSNFHTQQQRKPGIDPMVTCPGTILTMLVDQARAFAVSPYSAPTVPFVTLDTDSSRQSRSNDNARRYFLHRRLQQRHSRRHFPDACRFLCREKEWRCILPVRSTSPVVKAPSGNTSSNLGTSRGAKTFNGRD